MSQRREKLGIIAVILAVSAGAYFVLIDRDVPTIQPTPARSASPEARTQIPPTEEGVQQAMPESQDIAAAIAPVVEEDDMPPPEPVDPSTLRSQAEGNPHMTPAALVDFAHQQAALMQKAMESEKAAAPVYAHLEECVADTKGQQVVQARLICLANASRLAKDYPDLLGAKFQALAKRTPQLMSMLEATGLE